MSEISMGGNRRGKGSSAPSCDQCRERKVKCTPASPGDTPSAVEGSSARPRCAVCARREETCSYDYTYRKPGRPKSQCAPASRSSASPPPRNPPSVHVSGSSPVSGALTGGSSSGTAVRVPDPVMPPSLPAREAVLPQSFFGSARQTLASPATFSFDYNLPSSPCPLDLADVIGHPVNQFPRANVFPTDTGSEGQGNFDDLHQFLYEIGQSPISFFASPSDPLSSVTAPATDISRLGPNATNRPPQVEDIASWGDVSFLISLHVQYQHALVPLCHQPSLAKDILRRRDQKDEAFRCFLLSIVSYTICQCPVQSLLTRMSRETLEALLRRAQRASRVIQIRHQMKPSLLILASTVLDWITSQATTSVELSDNLLSDVRRLSYGLNLHRSEPREGMSSMELEISRRVFWEAYVIDKTNALNGHPILMHDADGLPPLPCEVDDDMIPAQGPSTFPQPPGEPSYMVGFGTVARIFQWIYRCQWRHRMFVGDPTAGADRSVLLAWIGDAKSALAIILGALPMQLRPDFTTGYANSSLYGMQAANICITALCLELALLDLKSSLSPHEDTAVERASTAKRVLGELEKIPIQCLAMNGESMRGKVLRVVLSLLNVSKQSDDIGNNVWDWWTMYSRVQFLQIIPAQAPPVVPTRPQSPA